MWRVSGSPTVSQEAGTLQITVQFSILNGEVLLLAALPVGNWDPCYVPSPGCHGPTNSKAHSCICLQAKSSGSEYIFQSLPTWMKIRYLRLLPLPHAHTNTPLDPQVKDLNGTTLMLQMPMRMPWEQLVAQGP